MNILLIGMPGCGKTSIGKKVAKKLEYNFLDLDSEIEKNQNTSISKIFDDFGEEYFRTCETEALKLSLKADNTIISTGGGIVKNSVNIELARQNGAYIIFFDRPLELIIGDIDTSKRPLLKSGADKLKTLYDERYDLYKEAADYTIKNNGSFMRAVHRVVRHINDIV